MIFPQYRKYKNEKSFFKVLSKEEFEEIKHQPGDKWEATSFRASILPDRVFIADMLSNHNGSWETINEEEYENIKIKVRNS